MGQRFAVGKKAKGLCDVCGFAYKLADLKELRRNGRYTSLKACKECWEEDHPQNELGKFPVHDPQALRDPRPDTAELASSRELKFPQVGNTARGLVGTVTVVTA